MKKEKQQIPLKMGKMTSREVAEWMGISYNTYRSNISKRLEDLSLFADFDQIYGGVVIKEIYNYYYEKSAKINMDKTYVRLEHESSENLTSLAGMARKLQNIEGQYVDFSERALQSKLRQAGVRTFGATEIKESQGICGSRHYVWAIKVDDFNTYRTMTDEEKQLFIELTNKYSSNKYDAPTVWDIELLREDYENGEISAEDYVKEVLGDKKDFYLEVLAEFELRTGFLPVKATQHEEDEVGIRRLLGEDDQS